MLQSCKKSAIDQPANLPIDLKDSTIVFGKYASYDLNGDGQRDLLFHTQLVGDPVSQRDKRQWLISSSFFTNLAVDHEEKIPAMHQGEHIPVGNFAPYHWYNASSILLAQKNIGLNSIDWEGQWLDLSHRFIPFQVIKDNGLFNGWVEASFQKSGEKLVLHRAFLSNSPNTAIKAGE